MTNIFPDQTAQGLESLRANIKSYAERVEVLKSDVYDRYSLNARDLQEIETRTREIAQFEAQVAELESR